jgi:hypothetical protein
MLHTNNNPVDDDENNDDVLNMMKMKQIPLTRQNYIDLAYMGQTPEQDAEFESNLPKRFRLNA